MKVAVLGTGRMGAAIARRLADEHDLVLWNRTPERAAAVGVGRVARSLEAAVLAAEVVVTSLRDDGAVEEVYLERAHAREALRRPWVDTSTVRPTTAERVSAEMAERGALYAQAPVMGTPEAVAAGRAAVLVAGPGAEGAADLLETLGTVRRIDTVAHAMALKLISNVALAATAAVAAELQVAGHRLGLDDADTFWALARQVPHMESRRAAYFGGETMPVGFPLRDMVKDLDAAAEPLSEAAAWLPFTTLTDELYRRWCAEHGAEDRAAIVDLFRQAGP